MSKITIRPTVCSTAFLRRPAAKEPPKILRTTGSPVHPQHNGSVLWIRPTCHDAITYDKLLGPQLYIGCAVWSDKNIWSLIYIENRLFKWETLCKNLISTFESYILRHTSDQQLTWGIYIVWYYPLHKGVIKPHWKMSGIWSNKIWFQQNLIW